MFDELIGLFEQVPSDEERVTVLRSTGPVFCSGIDLNERLVHGAPPLAELCAVIRDYPLPVVGIVHGDAIAGGAFLAMACDFVVAAEAASIWFSLVQIGLAPPFELTNRLRMIAGPALARRLVLLGNPITAAELARFGAIASAVPSSHLEAEATGIIDRLAANSLASLRAIKATLLAGEESRDPAAATDLIVTARDSRDGTVGVQARLAGRLPEYNK
jgi:enoyl-CoA hydratase/carnithine racemase